MKILDLKVMVRGLAHDLAQILPQNNIYDFENYESYFLEDIDGDGVIGINYQQTRVGEYGDAVYIDDPIVNMEDNSILLGNSSVELIK